MSHPFQTTSGPDFPLAALPEWLGVYVADVAASFQVLLKGGACPHASSLLRS